MSKTTHKSPESHSLAADIEWVKANIEFLAEEYYSQAIVVRNRKVEAYYPTVEEACAEASKRFAPDTYTIHNMRDFRCEEDKKWDDTLENMTEADHAKLDRMFDRMDREGEDTPLDFTGR